MPPVVLCGPSQGRSPDNCIFFIFPLFEFQNANLTGNLHKIIWNFFLLKSYFNNFATNFTIRFENWKHGANLRKSAKQHSKKG